MITARQIEYLLLFATQSSCGRYIANATEEFGVTTATASQASTTLEREGLIRKYRGSKLELTAYTLSNFDITVHREEGMRGC